MENDCYTKDLVVVKGKANFNPTLVFWCMDKRCGPMVATFLVKAFYVRQTEYHNVKDILWTYTSGKFWGDFGTYTSNGFGTTICESGSNG